ncbi:Dual specificity protein phosphatase 4 [Holothuria leucospilota]|uniref:protein-tyrosine-phosphatase n=1 Tax=Holothuria leucospilota TaxID=206669 RepID=A0A9Q0YSA5_HOLLE|nr:Dual specificity protein phosphatase 4 [Holothuria leucospilota]
MTVSIQARKLTDADLCSLVRGEHHSTLLLDCRPFFAFREGHLRKAVNAHVPKLLRRRSKDPMKLENILNCSESREKLRHGLFSTVVVYDDTDVDISGRDNSDDMKSVLECLIQQPHSHLTTEICYLAGGFQSFARKFPELCEFSPTTHSVPTTFRLQPLQVPSSQQAMTDVAPRIPCKGTPKQRPCLPRLCIQPPDHVPPITFSNSTVFCEPKPPVILGECQSVPTRKQPDEPVCVLPHLYLGNACHSECRKTLQRLGVTAVLNVSKRCPNNFPQSLVYKNIPVDDDTDADLSPWFQEAASFIDLVKEQSGRVFVHCKAGISRSATICMAYLMISQRFRLDEAFEYVHLRRTIISPNLAFMLQLQRLETDLFGKSPCDLKGSDTEFFGGRRMVRSVSLPCTRLPNLGLSPGGIKKDSLAVSAMNINRRDKWSPGFFCPSPFQSFRPIASPS